MDRYPNEKDRYLSELVITRVDGGYVVELRDHETGRKKAAWSGKLLDLARVLEQALTCAELPWTPFKSYRNPKGLDRHKEKKT